MARFECAAGRCGVKLDADGKLLSLKPDNLQPIATKGDGKDEAAFERPEAPDTPPLRQLDDD